MSIVNVDIIDKSVPPERPVNIAIINQPNPVTNYPVNGDQMLQLIQFPQYWITDNATGVAINGGNIYDFYPELRPGGGGGGGGFTPTPTQLDAMNSGINSTKVAQIATNTNDISTIQQTIGDINTVLEGVL